MKHLYKHRLFDIRNTVNSVIPVDVRIPINYEKKEMTAELEETCKKMHCNVDNLLVYNEKVYSYTMRSKNTQKQGTANVKYLKCFIAVGIQ